MIVTLRAAERETEHGLTERLHAVRVVVGEILLGDRAALVRHHIVALETRGDQIGVGAIGQKVSRQLLHEKAVVRFIVVEGLDDPVAPEPHVPTTVDGETVRVRVARGVEPIESHALAEVRTREEAGDEFRIRVRIAVRRKRLHLGSLRRQARQIKRETADECATVRLRSGADFFLSESRADEGVDGLRTERERTRKPT